MGKDHYYDRCFFPILKVHYMKLIVWTPPILYYSIGFKKSTKKSWRQINKSVGEGLLIRHAKYYADFVKQTLYNIFFYILCNIIKPIAKKWFKPCLIFTRLFWGGWSGEYEIKPVLFLYALWVGGGKKTLFKRKKKE